MLRRVLVAAVLALLLTSMLTLAFNAQSFSIDASLKEPRVHVDTISVNPRDPTPMGIVDYGLSQSGSYRYVTNSSVGIVTINSLNTWNSSNGDYAYWMSFQLNVNLVFTIDDVLYDYWIQDMARINTLSRYVFFLDNIWNFSAWPSSMSETGVIGYGNVILSDYGSFYNYSASQYLRGNNITLTYPATITFNVTSFVGRFGQPTVSFAYDDGYGLITYDTVTFVYASGASLAGFEVNGSDYNPAGFYYDSELILGGYGGEWSGTTAQDPTNITLQLEYWNGNNYQSVPNAYNYGWDTWESVADVTSEFSYNSENGAIFAQILSGNGDGTLGELYDQSQTGTLDLNCAGLASGTLYVHAFNGPDDPLVDPWQIPSVSGEVSVTLYPGPYTLQLYENGQLISPSVLFIYTVSAGLTLEIIDRILIISAAFGGGTTSPLPRTYADSDGRQFYVQALPSAGYAFNYWELDGDYAGSTNPILVTMNANHILFALFTGQASFGGPIAAGGGRAVIFTK